MKMRDFMVLFQFFFFFVFCLSEEYILKILARKIYILKKNKQRK